MNTMTNTTTMKLICTAYKSDEYRDDADWVLLELTPESARQLLDGAQSARAFLDSLIKQGLADDRDGCISYPSPVNFVLFGRSGSEAEDELYDRLIDQWACVPADYEPPEERLCRIECCNVLVFSDGIYLKALHRYDSDYFESRCLSCKLLESLTDGCFPIGIETVCL
jgi:hypothetical protein